MTEQAEEPQGWVHLICIYSPGQEWVRSKVSKGRAIILAKIATMSAVNQNGNF